MGPMELGSTLMSKYRLDRFLGEHEGALVYEGTDVVHGRSVRVRLCSQELAAYVIAADATIIDIGAWQGATYVVTSSQAASFPAPSRPMHLPSLTTTLSGLGSSPRLEIVSPPAWEEAFFESVPLPEDEPTLPVERRSWLWLALPIAALSAFAGWYLARTPQHLPVSQTTITAAEVQPAVASVSREAPRVPEAASVEAAPPPRPKEAPKHPNHVRRPPVRKAAPLSTPLPNEEPPLTL